MEEGETGTLGLTYLHGYIQSVLVAPLYLTVSGNPMDCSPPGSSVRAIHQARILEWVTIPFSWGSS